MTPEPPEPGEQNGTALAGIKGGNMSAQDTIVQSKRPEMVELSHKLTIDERVGYYQSENITDISYGNNPYQFVLRYKGVLCVQGYDQGVPVDAVVVRATVSNMSELLSLSSGKNTPVKLGAFRPQTYKNGDPRLVQYNPGDLNYDPPDPVYAAEVSARYISNYLKLPNIIDVMKDFGEKPGEYTSVCVSWEEEDDLGLPGPE